MFEVAVDGGVDAGAVLGVDKHKHRGHGQDQDHGEEGDDHEVEHDSVTCQDLLDIVIPTRIFRVRSVLGSRPHSYR